MRNRRPASGFTYVELLLTVTIVAIFAAIAIPALMRSEKTRVNEKFQGYFGFSLPEFTDGEFGKPGDWLTPEQKNILRPSVQKRLQEICDPSDQREHLTQQRTELLNGPPATESKDAMARIRHLAELDAKIALLGAPGSTLLTCLRARKVAEKLDLFTEEK